MNSAVPETADHYVSQEWRDVLCEMAAHIQSDGTARVALTKLVNGGCCLNVILANLYMYCGGSPEMQSLTKQDFRRQKKQVLSLAKKLSKISKELVTVSDLVSELGFTVHFFPDVQSIALYGQFLKRLGITVLHKLASGRNTGRDQHLVFLCLGVESVTGREHYKELADLINATLHAYDPKCKVVHDADSVRKLISRHELCDPKLLEGLEEFRAPDSCKQD